MPMALIYINLRCAVASADYAEYYGALVVLI